MSIPTARLIPMIRHPNTVAVRVRPEQPGSVAGTPSEERRGEVNVDVVAGSR